MQQWLSAFTRAKSNHGDLYRGIHRGGVVSSERVQMHLVDPPPQHEDECCVTPPCTEIQSYCCERLQPKASKEGHRERQWLQPELYKELKWKCFFPSSVQMALGLRDTKWNSYDVFLLWSLQSLPQRTQDWNIKTSKYSTVWSAMLFKITDRCMGQQGEVFGFFFLNQTGFQYFCAHVYFLPQSHFDWDCWIKKQKKKLRRRRKKLVSEINRTGGVFFGQFKLLCFLQILPTMKLVLKRFSFKITKSNNDTVLEQHWKNCFFGERTDRIHKTGEITGQAEENPQEY